MCNHAGRNECLATVANVTDPHSKNPELPGQEGARVLQHPLSTHSERSSKLLRNAASEVPRRLKRSTRQRYRCSPDRNASRPVSNRVAIPRPLECGGPGDRDQGSTGEM